MTEVKGNIIGFESKYGNYGPYGMIKIEFSDKSTMDISLGRDILEGNNLSESIIGGKVICELKKKRNSMGYYYARDAIFYDDEENQIFNGYGFGVMIHKPRPYNE